MQTNPMPLIMSVPKEILAGPIKSWTWMICDESWIAEEIQMTHCPDGREIDVQPILPIIRGILKDCSMAVHSPSEVDNTQGGGNEMVRNEVNRLSHELAYKGSEVVDVHAKTIDLFNMVPSFPWEAKLALTLAALVSNYGEYWVLAQTRSESDLAKTMALLRQMSDTVLNDSIQNSRFEVLHKLIESVLCMINCIMGIKKFISSADVCSNEAMVSTAIVTIVIGSYWTVRSVVVSTSYIHSLFAEVHNFRSGFEEWEIDTLTQKIQALCDCLQEQQTGTADMYRAAVDSFDIDHADYTEVVKLRIAKAIMDILQTNASEAEANPEAERDADREAEDMYRAFVHSFETDHADNTEILKLLFDPKGDDSLPIFDGPTKQRVALQVFKNKYVGLLLSSLDMSEEMIANLRRIWILKSVSDHEIIWFPVVQHPMEWTECMQEQFEALRSRMPFYSVHDPRSISSTVLKFVKEKHHFEKVAILPVFDPHGKIVHPNAIQMLWIWEQTAFPLTLEHEDLRRRSPLSLFSLSSLTSTLQRECCIVYGGVDMEWIERLTTKAKEVSSSIGIDLGTFYVGKSSGRDRVRKITNWIHDKQMSDCWKDMTNVWLFWSRIESLVVHWIRYMKNRSEVEGSGILLARFMLSFDRASAHQEWTLVVDNKKAFNVILDGRETLKALDEIHKWKEDATNKGIATALFDYIKGHSEDSFGCTCLEFPDGTVETPDSAECVCSRPMKKCISLLCCHDAHH